MKNVLFREALREIRRSKSRFFSILAIVAIGSGFFSGVKAACPDMKNTAETYLGDSNLADFHLLSGWGFDEEDIEAIQSSGDIRAFSAGYSKDLLTTNTSGDELVIKAIGYDAENTLNLPLVHEGRLPEAANECVIGTSSLDEPHWELGDTLNLYGDNEDLSDTLSGTEYTVVGIAQLPQYFGYSYGTTTISDGTLDGFILIPEENFTLDVYTDVYLSFESTKDLPIFSDEYDQAVEDATSRLEALGKERTQARFEETRQELSDGIADGEKEIADGEKELSDAETSLSDARKELDENWESYYDQKAEAEQKLSDAEDTLAASEKELDAQREKWQRGKDEYDASAAQLSASRETLDGYIAQRDALSAQLSDAETQLDSGKTLLAGIGNIQSAFSSRTADLSGLDEDTLSLIQTSSALDEGMPELLTGYITSSGSEKAAYASALSQAISAASASLDQSQQQLTEGKTQLDALSAAIESGEAQYRDGKAQLDAAKKTIDSGASQLESAQAQLDSARKELDASRKDADDSLDEAYQKLTDGENEYQDGLNEYNEKLPDARQKIADAKTDLSDAEETLSTLKAPEWYLLDHSNFPGVGTIADDSDKVDAIAAVFPVFFVLVAALVCLTTMTRMVEEQRTQIGTMKALGFKGSAIVMKYLLYAALASICGSVFGCLIGLKLLPMVIINCYRAMYQVPYILTPIHWDYLAGCMIVSVICTGAVTLATCCGVLKSVPAQLMRPKSPKNGKRILFERITPFWNRLSFSHKVTFRNLFRYKSRMLMTVIGVAGCTALMLTGFGLRYAISSIASRQFGGVFTYDATLSIAENLTDEEVSSLKENALSIDGVENAMTVTSKKTDIQSLSGKSVSSIYLYVPSEPDNLTDFIGLRDAESGEPLELDDNGAIITKKLSKLLSVSVGDTVRIQSSDGEGVDVTVEAIAETYINHYVYITPTLYTQLYGTPPSPTALLITETDGSDSAQVSSALLGIDNVQGVIGMSYYADAFSDLISSLNMIVWVLILSAAALAVIVMYNLININVSERMRELATIKVLGFYDREVSAYICRENTASALMGMCAGLLGGIWLEDFVVNTAEVDVVLFVHGLPLSAYLMAAGLTLLFILIVNRIVHHSLKKIDMVESLKSVE